MVPSLGVLLLALAAISAVSASPAPELRAGAAASNVTPWLDVSINGGMQDQRATAVHDELHARALLLEGGGDRIALVIVDSCMLPRGVVDDAKRQIREALGLPSERILIAATHSHSTGAATPVFQSDPDPAYPSFLARRISDAVRRAAGNLQPARIGW